MRPHPIGRMNFLIVEAFEIDRVRAVNGDFAVVDVPGNRADETEIFVFVVTGARSRKNDQRETAASAEGEHFKLATEPGCVPFEVTFVHLLD